MAQILGCQPPQASLLPAWQPVKWMPCSECHTRAAPVAVNLPKAQRRGRPGPQPVFTAAFAGQRQAKTAQPNAAKCSSKADKTKTNGNKTSGFCKM